MVYSDKKKRNFFVIANHTTKVGKRFWKEVGTSGGSVRWAKKEILEGSLRCEPGEVNPFALRNDFENKLPLIIIDENLKEAEFWSFHPMDNAVSLEIKNEDVRNILTNEFAKTVQFVALEDDKYPEPVKGGKGGKGGKGDKQQKQKVKHNKKDNKNKEGMKKETKLKMTFDKSTEFSEWYSEIIKKGDLIDYYDISGCYILKPNSYFIWEQIQNYLDRRFKELGVKNVYFPMFVKKKHLESEKDHLEGFSAEVAWVTHSGSSKMEEPIAIRPTSETIMYPIFKNWIDSHRDLPLLINQWTNVVRWEFKHPTPFIRTREFLWQEGHTVHETNEHCAKFVKQILDIYADCYREVLCIPVMKGEKSEIEKFAGADYTTTCETFIPEVGRSVQACTSHNLGQNFAKIFKLSFKDKNMVNQEPFQASWGLSTRSIGALIMVHGDNTGLILPPAVASVQVVIIPITFNKDSEQVLTKCEEVRVQLKEAGYRVELDDRTNYKPGWKYNHWELRGVPLRLEIGPKDIEKDQVRAVSRLDKSSSFIPLEKICDGVAQSLDQIKVQMMKNAQDRMDSKRGKAANWDEFMNELNQMKYIQTLWCTQSSCEEDVKQKSAEDSDESIGLSGKAKTLCLPFDQNDVVEGDKCFNCEKPAKKYVLWGRSY